jgi:D-threo-aldose 1-dehydrogenase
MLMQSIALGETGRTTTRLGFGCSSVMGGLGHKESLAMLEAAYDAGIRHFDVAPMYGFGEAEGCVGTFLARHPGQVTITTKYGIPPERKQALKAFARSVARPLIKLVPSIKKRLAAAASSVSQANEGPGPKSAFSADEARASLEHSLRELRVERIDLWLLHEASVADLQDDGLLRLLEDSVAQGKIGSFGVGSGVEKVASLLAERPAYCRVLQYEWSVLDPKIPADGGFRLHHRALGGNFHGFHAALTSKPETCRVWSDAVGADLADAETLAQLMLKASLVMNPESVILFSSKRPGHIAANVRVADDVPLGAKARSLHERVQAEPGVLLPGAAE